MGYFIGLVLWIGLSYIAGNVAEKKGRSFNGFFFLSLIISPFIGILIAAVASENKSNVEKEMLESRKYKKCTSCAELVKIDAKMCRYCGKDDFIKSL